MFATLRNGNPAATVRLAVREEDACPTLEGAFACLLRISAIFQREWGFLYRNISGKYRVTKISDSAPHMIIFKRITTAALVDGNLHSF